jgi:VIT1/CCC1 family predicted Fe2+/Mn2+ transporter
MDHPLHQREAKLTNGPIQEILMTQADLKSSIQTISERITNDATTFAAFVIGGAVLCVPVFGFTPLMSVLLGMLGVLAMGKMIDSRIEKLETGDGTESGSVSN